MKEVIFMKYKHLFGPVPSRRLGISLGVDLVKHKTCSLDCLYCECGKTNNLTVERKEYVNAEEVIEEIKDIIHKGIYLDYITFSGSGEPLLNSKIGYIIKEIKKITDTKIAILTNATAFTDENLIDEILDVDLIVPSLDAVSQDVFKKINNPEKTLKIEDIINGLISLRNKFKNLIFLEIFIIEGINDGEREILKFKEVINQIKPDKIQLNSLDRPSAYEGIEKANMSTLEKIKKELAFENLEIITKYKYREDIRNYNLASEELILNMIGKRPCTIEDLCQITSLKKSELNKYLDILEKEKLVKTEKGERGIFLKKI